MKFWWKEKRERGRKTNTDRQRHRETRRDTERSGVGRVDSTGRDTRALWKQDMQNQAKQGKKVAEKET